MYMKHQCMINFLPFNMFTSPYMYVLVLTRLGPIAQIEYDFKVQKIKNFDFEIFDINLH